MLLLLLLIEFNPDSLVKFRKNEFSNSINDLTLIVKSDSLVLHYYWDKNTENYRLNVDYLIAKDTSYSIIRNSGNLWKVNDFKERKKKISFTYQPNLWIYNWNYSLPNDFQWIEKNKGAVKLEYKNNDAKINIWMDRKGRIKEVVIESQNSNTEINYTGYMDIGNFLDYPSSWVFKSDDRIRKFKVVGTYVNKINCPPCLFKIPNYKIE